MKNSTPYRKIAHRGASGYEPENTLRAFEKAIELGADMIEIDVHLSQDGELVVVHDRDVAGVPVVQQTVAQLQQLDVGKGERIPTMQQTIDFVKGRCGLYIELKGAGTEQPVVDIVRANNLVEDVVISSFDAMKVRRSKDIAPEILAAVLTEEIGIDYVALARAAGADCIHFCWQDHPRPHTLLTPELMQTCAQAGLKVVIWHEERPEEIRAIVQHDIYGICSDLPDRLIL